MALSYAKPYFPYTRIDKKRASGEGSKPIPTAPITHATRQLVISAQTSAAQSIYRTNDRPNLAEPDLEKARKFAAAPGHTTKLSSPMGLPAYAVIGGTRGLQQRLEGGCNSGLSVDGQEQNGRISFRNATTTKSHRHLPERKAPSLILALWLAYRLKKATTGALILRSSQEFLEENAWLKWVVAVVFIVAVVVVASSDCAGGSLREERRSVDSESMSVLEEEPQEGQAPLNASETAQPPMPHPMLGGKSLKHKVNIASSVHVGTLSCHIEVMSRQADLPIKTGPTRSTCQPRLLLCIATLAYCCLTRQDRLGGLVLSLFITVATVASCLLGLFLVSWAAPARISVDHGAWRSRNTKLASKQPWMSLGSGNADDKAELLDWSEKWSEDLSKPSNILEQQADSHFYDRLSHPHIPVQTRAQQRGKTGRIKISGSFCIPKKQHSRLLQLLARPHRSPLAFYFVCVVPRANAAPIPGGPADKVHGILEYMDEIWQVALILTPYMVVLWGLVSVVKTLVQSPKTGRPLISGASALGTSFAWWAVRCTEDMPTKTEAIYLTVFAAFWANFVAYSCRPVEHKIEYVLGIAFGGGMFTLLVSALAFIAGQKANGPDAAAVFFSRTYDICPGGLFLSSLGMHLWRGHSDHPSAPKSRDDARYSTKVELGEVGAGHRPDVASSGRDTGDVPSWANESYQRSRLVIQGEGDPHGVWRLERLDKKSANQSVSSDELSDFLASAIGV